jgi:hypothetical protein
VTTRIAQDIARVLNDPHGWCELDRAVALVIRRGAISRYNLRTWLRRGEVPPFFVTGVHERLYPVPRS